MYQLQLLKKIPADINSLDELNRNLVLEYLNKDKGLVRKRTNK